MIQTIPDMPDGCDGLSAEATVTREDYHDVIVPFLEQAHREGRRIRLLYQVGPDFQGFTAGAAWEDLRVGLHFLRLFERLAIVSDINWICQSSRLCKVFLPCPVRIFGLSELTAAKAWLATASPTSGLTYRFMPETKLLLVEPKGPLTAEDFESISLTVDPWIESQGSLQGVIIRVAQFPGWENVFAFIRHFRFVREHHRKVQRVALVANGKLATFIPSLAQHFVQAEVKQFDYECLDDATSWAAANKAPES